MHAAATCGCACRAKLPPFTAPTDRGGLGHWHSALVVGGRQGNMVFWHSDSHDSHNRALAQRVCDGRGAAHRGIKKGVRAYRTAVFGSPKGVWPIFPGCTRTVRETGLTNRCNHVRRRRGSRTRVCGPYNAQTTHACLSAAAPAPTQLSQASDVTLPNCSIPFGTTCHGSLGGGHGGSTERPPGCAVAGAWGRRGVGQLCVSPACPPHALAHKVACVRACVTRGGGDLLWAAQCTPLQVLAQLQACCLVAPSSHFDCRNNQIRAAFPFPFPYHSPWHSRTPHPGAHIHSVHAPSACPSRHRSPVPCSHYPAGRTSNSVNHCPACMHVLALQSLPCNARNPASLHPPPPTHTKQWHPRIPPH